MYVTVCAFMFECVYELSPSDMVANENIYKVSKQMLIELLYLLLFQSM